MIIAVIIDTFIQLTHFMKFGVPLLTRVALINLWGSCEGGRWPMCPRPSNVEEAKDNLREITE